MKGKKELATITIECDNKETLKNVLNSLKDAMESIVYSIEEDEIDDKEPEAFCPKKGDICTCIGSCSNIDTIFRYDGNTRTDEDGVVWLDGDLGLTWSGDLFKPYMVIHGEGAEYDRDCCRLANEEEIKLFNAKVKEFEEVRKEDKWVPKTDEEYWSPAREHFVGCAFVPGKVGWLGDAVDHQLLEKGWVFRTKEECQPICDKLNEAIKNVTL